MKLDYDFMKLGKAFEELGRAMQLHHTNIEHLTRLAMDAGLSMQFRLVPITEKDLLKESNHGQESENL